jgi:hypothetical protein
VFQLFGQWWQEPEERLEKAIRPLLGRSNVIIPRLLFFIPSLCRYDRGNRTKTVYRIGGLVVPLERTCTINKVKLMTKSDAR